MRELENLVERLAVCAEGPVIRVGDLPGHLRPARTSPPAFAPAPPPSFAPTFAPAFAPAPPPPAAAPSAVAPGPVAEASDADHADLAEPPPPPTPLFRVLHGGAEVPPPQLPAFDGQTIDLPSMLRRLEQAYIDAALAHTQGNKKAAADLLGLQRTTLVEKLRRRTRDASVC